MKYFCSFLLILPTLLFADFSNEYNGYLRVAVKYGNLKMARLSLQNDANPNINMLEGTGVVLKAYYTNKDIMKLLISYGADKTPIIIPAVSDGDIKTCEFLAEENTEFEDHLLFFAKGLDMLEWLLDRDLDVNAERNITGDYSTKRLLFNALFVTIGYGSRQERIRFQPNYPMLELLKNYRVDTSLPVLDSYTIFELIDKDQKITAEDKAVLKYRLRETKPCFFQSARSKL